jgi:glycosyltransferase involved in cell wall biosynthesis
MYLFSIVTPVYKRAKEISELLQSISHQDYKNFEVIIIDNSPDDSLSSTILPYTRHLKLSYRHHKGLGVSESRNLGVKYATGDYVIFIDSDCIMPPSYLTL